MNPVAERLTEWSAAEAKGKPLSTVFQIINEETRESTADPAQRCRVEDRVIGLANHSVLVSRSGREYSIQDSAAPIRDRDGRMLGVILVFHDVTESRRMAREAAHHATHDALTGLVNRREFDRRLEQALDNTKRYGVRNALCYLDLDQFKIVNDVAGHRAGDQLLKYLTTILKKQVRERDTIARLGGDEFGLLLGNCPIDKALDIAETLVISVREFKFVWDKRSFDVGVSIGLVEVTGEVQTAEELLTHADVACYAAKDLGRNRVHLYQKDNDGSDPQHREILRAADMRNAIERNRFRLYCQPIVSLSTAVPLSAHYEILLRLLDDRGQLIIPGGFIPAAERYGIMSAIDRWVVRSTFQDFDKLFPGRSGITISINLSGNSLNDDDLLTFLKEMISIYRIDPQQICFEITETAAIRNLTAAGRLVRAMRDLGGHFALDDFGAGLSSFAYLKNLPVDYLKIDGSLVCNIPKSDHDRAIVEALNQLAHRLGIETVAEYAETPATLSVLQELGVDYAQGYALGRAVPLPLEINEDDEIKEVRLV
jgi:diguanylate cyclase (GGDEF)-like protein/PAS domain S-box-containing protein